MLVLVWVSVFVGICLGLHAGVVGVDVAVWLVCAHDRVGVGVCVLLPSVRRWL